MSDPPLWSTAAAAALLLLLLACVPASAAPMHDPQQVQHQLDEYYGGSTATGCYYNFVHYEEGDRIMTNEPCLNCTCHNRMLMCYLRVCPFSKGIGQDCTVEQKPDQCCPVITCPEVPVQLITSSTTITTPPAPTGSTAVGHPDNYGCTIDEVFYSDGTKIPGDPTKPCELCYCIRNHTACVMQECTLHVEGCRPVYAEGICCPVRYDCDYQEYTTSAPLLETTVRPTPGLLFTTTMAGPLDCRYGEETYADGALIETEEPCQHCYCMRGDIVCAVQECGTPLEREAGNCTALPPQPGQCCPQQYQCDNVTVPFDILSQEMETAQTSKSTASSVTSSTKSDEQVSLSTEATVVQQSNQEEHAQQQGNIDETQEHLNEVEQGSEQHTHYDDEETEKETEIEHITNPAEHEGQGTIEHFTQSVEHLPEHPAEGSGHITLESESSVTEAVIASSEKQRTTLEGAETVTESLTELNVASISEGIQTIEQVTQQELAPSSTENGNQDVHGEQSLPAEADNHPSAVQTTSSAESASPTNIGQLTDVQVTTEQNVPELVTLKDEIDFTHKSTSATQKPSDTAEESVPVTHGIVTGESDSTEKVEQQDLMSSSPHSSPTNDFITPAVEIHSSTDKNEESASSENIPDAVEPLEGEEAESHVTDTQIHEDEHTVAAPVSSSVVAETGGITMPVQGVEHEIVTEGQHVTTFESGNKVTVTESTEEHITSGPILESSSAADKFDEVSHEQSVTEANVAEEVGHTSNEASSEVHEAEQQVTNNPPQLPLDELATISEELEPSTGAESIHHTTSKSDSTGFVSELTTSASSDKQEESSSQATETVLNEDTDNESDSATKVDETEQVTLFHDIISSSESSINAENRPEETGSVGELPPDTDTSLNEVLTTVQPAAAVTGVTQEGSINLLPGEEVGKPSESSEATSAETADESEISAEVPDNIDTVTTKLETTEESIKEQPVTAPTDLKPSASTGKTDEGLLITQPPETAEPSASNEVSFESSGDSTEESVHHLVSEMNGKPTEIHTTPSESALSSQSSHEVTSGISEESQPGSLGATEPAPPKEPVVVHESSESELFEQESSQKPDFEEDAEVVTDGSVPSEEHGTESVPQETKAPHETETASEANQKPGTQEEIATEQAAVSEGLQQEPVEQQVVPEVTETVIIEQSSGGIPVISTPGFDEIEHEISQQQTQESTEAGVNQYTTEVSASGISDTAAEQLPQKPAEDGGLPSVEGSAVTLETVTPPHDAPPHQETQESVESEKQPSELPLTTSGVGGFVQDLSTTTSMLGPVGIPTSVPPHALIPGEGNCLVDGKTYANNSEIPPPSHCHVSCQCMSSIVHCVSVNCPPPPTHLKNCTPVRHSNDACCPTYTCDVEHKVTLVADSMVAATGRPTVSSETSAAPTEDHKEDVKPQITDGSPSLNTDQNSNVVTEAHPVHHDTETEEQENAGDTVHDTVVTEKPGPVSSPQDEHMPSSPEPTETQESHIPSSEKPADEHVMQQGEKDQEGTEVQQTVQPVEEGVIEEQAPSEEKPEGTEAVIQEGADTLEHTVSPSESSATLSDKNEDQATTEKVSAEHEIVPTMSPAGISENKEDHTYSPTSSVEDATTVLIEHLPGSSDEILSPGSPSTASEAEGPQQPVAAVTEHTGSSPGLSSSVIDEQNVENFTVSTDHVTAAVEESAHEDQSSQTVSSTDQAPVTHPQMEVTDAQSVINEQSPSESIPDEKLPPAETVTDDQQTVSIIHSDVPTVAPPESDSHSKHPTTASSVQEKPQEVLNTGKPEVSSSRPESYETITPSSSNDNEQQATTSVIHHVPSEKPSDNQQETEHQTDFPAVTGLEEAVFPQQTGEVITEEGSGHEEPIHPIVTEATVLEQQSSSHPEDMEEHQQTVSQGSLLTEEETTVQSESETQQSSVSTEHVPPVQPVGEEHGGVEPSSVQPETNKPEPVHQPLPGQDIIHTGESGDVQTVSPLESDSQQSSVAENHPFDSDLPTTQENDQSSPSVEAITEHLPQQPAIHEGEAESSEQTVTLPSSNKEDSTVIQESLVTEQQKQTEKLPEEMQTVSPIGDITQQESISQQPVELLSDTEETAEQQTLATVAASQQPETVMQEEVTDKISDDQQTLAPIESDAQHVVGSHPPEGSGAMETQEVQTLSPVVVEEESSTISQVSALPGGEAASETETGQQEELPSEEEKESVNTQQPIEAVSQQESVSEDKTADSITESYVDQQTSLPGDVNSQQDIISQEPVVDEEHMQTTLAAENHFEQTPSPFQPVTADKEPDTAEHEATTSLASDTQTFVSGEPISSEEEQPDKQQTLLPSEEDNQHVSVSQQNAPTTEEMSFQTSSPVYEDKESSASIVTVSEDKTPGISEETNKQTVHPLDHDVQHPVTSQEGTPVTEPAEQQTRFTVEDEMVHTENTQNPSQDSQQVTEILGLSDTVTNLPVEADSEQFVTGEEGIEKVTEAVEGQTVSPLDSENKQTDIPSRPITSEEVAQTVSSSGEEQTFPPVVPDVELTHPESQGGHEMTVTEILDEESTPGPEQPEISATPTISVAGMGDDTQITNTPEEHVSSAEETNDVEAGEVNADTQTVTSQEPHSPVETVSTVQDLGEPQPSTPEEIHVEQITTTPKPETSSEKTAELEGSEIQQSSVPSETGIEETSTPGEQEASVIEDTVPQQTISPIESGAQTIDVNQPAPDMEQEPAAPSEPEIQQVANTEQAIPAEGDSSIEETSTETATSAVQHPAPSKEEQPTSAESSEQTARPIESDVQEAITTESTSSDKDTSISFSKPADHDSVSQSTVTSDETHEVETIVSTRIPEDSESQSSSTNAPDVHHGEQDTTSAFMQPDVVQESGTVTLGIVHPSQTPIESADHHIEISEQSSQGTVTEATVVQHEVSHITEHTTSASIKPIVPDEEEEQVANNVHPVEVTEGNQILPASSEYPLHTTAQPAQSSSDHSDTSQASVVQENELEVNTSSTFHPDQKPAHSSTSHPAYEHFPEDHTLAAGEGIEHITEATKRPSHHFTTRPPFTTGSHHHPSQHPEDQYEQFPFGEGQYPTGVDTDYDDEEQAAFGPGTCRYGGKVYVSAQQIPRDDPCDFCFCFRSDIICLQQSCPPPIPGCHEEPIQGFCCPRYECPVSMATVMNVSTTTTTTTTTLPPHFLAHHYRGAAHRTGCQVQGSAYRVGEMVHSASGPCLECRCGGDGQMKCDPKECSPEPMLRKMIMAAASRRR